MRLNLENSDIFESIFRSGKLGSTTKLLSGNYLIGVGYDVAHFLDANGSDRNVILPANRKGLTFAIFNVGGTGNLVIKNSLAVTLVTLEPGNGTLFVSDPDEWGWIAGGGGGTSGATYPVVRSASGVITVDSSTDDHILVGSGTATINLPASATRTEGREYLFYDDAADADINAKTVTPNGLETVIGLTSVTIPLSGVVRLFPHPSGGWYGSVF